MSYMFCSIPHYSMMDIFQIIKDNKDLHRKYSIKELSGNWSVSTIPFRRPSGQIKIGLVAVVGADNQTNFKRIDFFDDVFFSKNKSS
jgi:hypothetical protein